MAYRMRSGSGSKRQLKEKVVQIYESFFKGEDLTLGNPNFWDELFLLKPKVAQLEAEILKLSASELLALKDSINKLFSHCVENLGHEHQIRVVYSLQTLCCLTDTILKKSSNDYAFDVIDNLIGFDVAQQKLKQLLDHMTQFLTGDYPESFKCLCLKLLLILVTASENVSQNTLLEYMMITNIFEPLIQLLKVSSSRIQHGHDAVLILTLLANYRKHEAANPYIVKLSILDDELALNGYSQVITLSLTEFCRHFISQHAEPQTAGWLSSITNIVGNMFVSEDGITKIQQIRAKNPVLMALYEAVHLNRNFITVLGHTQTDSSAPPSPSNTLNSSSPTPDLSRPPIIDIMTQPSNLLVTFFQYCSIVMQDTKTEASINHVKLCFLILTCVSEDQYANSLMHDVNLVFKVQLQRLPMRHRKLAPDKLSPSQPLASTLLDLLVEFIMSHMMKKLPLELYLLSVGVIHRLLCFQKRCRVRLSYQWKELWTALITFLKFLLANENHLAKKMNIFNLAIQIINIFNLFITYGDTFLPSAASYDELYYEIIRMHQVFDNLYSMALRYSTISGDFRDHAMKLTNCLVNIRCKVFHLRSICSNFYLLGIRRMIQSLQDAFPRRISEEDVESIKGLEKNGFRATFRRAIINHFSPKIESWLTSQSLSTPSEDQILEVVRKNYDSLTLKLQDSLDQFERYSEKPRHTAFFTSMMRGVVSDTKLNINYATLDLQAMLQDFSGLS